jgi:hypothetical protein
MDLRMQWFPSCLNHFCWNLIKTSQLRPFQLFNADLNLRRWALAQMAVLYEFQPD